MNSYPENYAKQFGFTLVEVMVSITIGLILLIGVGQVFLSSKAAYKTHNALARIQEDGRFAVSYFNRDIRKVDFWACGGGAILDFTNNLNPGGTGYTDFERAIDGTDGGIGSDGDAAKPDTLNLYSSDSTNSDTYSVEWHNQNSSAIHLSTAKGLSNGDIVAVCDPTSGEGDIFQITNNPPQNGAGNVVHNSGTGDPGNSNHKLAHSYSDGAILMKTNSAAYTIQDTGRDDKYGADIYGLYLNGAELVENVEDFQVLYGRDTDNDGLPEQYENASSFADVDPDTEKANWQQVVTVKFAILLRSFEQVRDEVTSQNFDLMDEHQLQFNDRYMRQVFTATVKIRNRGIM